MITYMCFRKIGNLGVSSMSTSYDWGVDVKCCQNVLFFR